MYPPVIAEQSDHTETRSEIPGCNLWYIDMSFTDKGGNVPGQSVTFIEYVTLLVIWRCSREEERPHANVVASESPPKIADSITMMVYSTRRK